MDIGRSKATTANAQPGKSAFAEAHPVAERTILLLRAAGGKIHGMMANHAEMAMAARQERERLKQEAQEAAQRHAGIQKANEELLDFYGLRGTESDLKFRDARAKEANAWLDVYKTHTGCVDDAMTGRSPPRR